MKKLFSIILITLGFNSVSYAKEVAGINLSDSITVYGQDLSLNGAGLREKWVFDVYAAGLYLEQPSDSAEHIINQNTIMVIKLQMLRDVSGQDMADAIFDGFKNAMDGNTDSLNEEISSFLKVFGKEATKGNIYQLAYNPETGVEVSINGNKENVIAGEAFKKALFAIWLGAKPAQDTLKDSLLGN